VQRVVLVGFSAGGLSSLPEDRLIEEASHCDFESPTDWICRLACGETDPQRQGVVREVLLGAVERWLPRSPRTP
jgi:hypothetical protein